ncbi:MULTISPECIES: YebC/PmpR family DNA-binding transcriptional regulator [Halomonadaceae]|jgi:YebC/PmpR family DNA-binding regulatory protein|uniref:Probable transcriptional regulatory protein GLW01_03110 n=1 Tax=Vreelandella halophila TaxID=86177 RepID=A0A9X4Y9M4_9GAMM|nr:MULTISPECIES: YebC/PmpR family DNA-binding transcriptional regulator [Halomonas]MYL25776.1 YebC/PmpR family DNA-binding transcriptional regulator [Halomonas utahensis]MYL75722.1 YebC/PmpR family DNA-binding transcriptional regulator [Halomonas sp. 22501_18_FS]
MAGHSKWHNIRHRKAAQDAKKGKIFTKLIKELYVAAKEGGPEPEDNPRLRSAVDKALSNNMKKDSIDRAIERGAGNADGENYEELVYEGYGPGGVAIYVEAMTDNKNRTVSDVRHAFSKFGGNLGTDGSVGFLFNRQGTLSFSPEHDEDTIMEAALEAGAEDVRVNDDGSKDVITTPEQYMDVKDSLKSAGLEPDHAEVSMVPMTTVALEEDGADTNLKLIDWLEDLDDVQNVYTNADFPEAALERFGYA